LHGPAGEYDTLLRKLHGDLLARIAKDRLKIGMDADSAIGFRHVDERVQGARAGDRIAGPFREAMGLAPSHMR
jgi:hypothetical protein